MIGIRGCLPDIDKSGGLVPKNEETFIVSVIETDILGYGVRGGAVK